MKLGWGNMHLRGWAVALPAVVLLAVTAAAVVLRPAEAGPGSFQSARLTPARFPGPCTGGATKPFTPTTAAIEDVGKGYTIQPYQRDSNDVPGVPPASATHAIAWDEPGPKPGSKRGLVRFNAHTWPNNGALGNAMLANFDVGDILTLSNGKTQLCYRVTERVEVDGYSTYDPFYELDGPSEFAFIVCSGKRLGPGNWTKRTIWFGTPYFGG